MSLRQLILLQEASRGTNIHPEHTARQKKTISYKSPPLRRAFSPRVKPPVQERQHEPESEVENGFEAETWIKEREEVDGGRTFEIFGRLPEDLREKIWEEATYEPRTISVWYDRQRKYFRAHDLNPSLLSVSKEARAICLSFLIPAFFTSTSITSTSRVIYLNVEADTTFLDPGPFTDLSHVIKEWHEALPTMEFRKVERLAIAMYDQRHNFAANAVETLASTLLYDQANSGMKLTKVQLVAHQKEECEVPHTRGVYAMAMDGEKVTWTEEMLDMVKKENESLLYIARETWGSEHNETYKEGEKGPLAMVARKTFCGQCYMEKPLPCMTTNNALRRRIEEEGWEERRLCQVVAWNEAKGCH